METLITVVDIAKYRPLAADIPADRIETYIKEAEVIDLQDVLGSKLYYDFKANLSVTKYDELLNGKDYAVDGVTITYDGLIPMLSYFALARFTPNSGNFNSATGYVKKKTDYSEPISAGEIAAMVSELRSIALAYKEKVRAFIIQHPTEYPLYNGYGEGLTTTGVKFFDL